MTATQTNKNVNWTKRRRRCFNLFAKYEKTRSVSDQGICIPKFRQKTLFKICIRKWKRGIGSYSSIWITGSTINNQAENSSPLLCDAQLIWEIKVQMDQLWYPKQPIFCAGKHHHQNLWTNINWSLCQADAEPIIYLVSETSTLECSASEGSLGYLFCR